MIRLHNESLLRRSLTLLATALVFAGLAVAAIPSASAQAARVANGNLGVSSGLALPRFASLKSDRVNVRRGPGTDYPIAWVFRRIGLPLEIIDEADVWRQIRDSEGATGWVHVRLLSGRRTALVAPWELTSGTTAVANVISMPVRGDASPGARIVARLEVGTLVGVPGCNGVSCEISTNGLRVWVEQGKLWGIYPGEQFE